MGMYTLQSFIHELSNRYSRFFNYTSRGAHNHTPFHLLVEWALGGTSKHLDAIWDQHEDIERYAHRSPAAITTDTAFEHLGDGDYYQAYLHFFSDLLLKTPLSVVRARGVDFLAQSELGWETTTDAKSSIGWHPPPHALSRLWNRV